MSKLLTMYSSTKAQNCPSNFINIDKKTLPYAYAWADGEKLYFGCPLEI